MQLIKITAALVAGISAVSAQVSFDTRTDACTTKYGKTSVATLSTTIAQVTARTYRSTITVTITPNAAATIVKTVTQSSTTVATSTSTIQQAGALQTVYSTSTTVSQSTAASSVTVQSTSTLQTTSVRTRTAQSTITPASSSTPLTTDTSTTSDQPISVTYTNVNSQYRGTPGSILVHVPSTTTSTSTITDIQTTFSKRDVIVSVTKRHAFGHFEARAVVQSYPTTVTCSQHVDVYSTVTVTKTAPAGKATAVTSTTTVLQVNSFTSTSLYTNQLADSTTTQATVVTSIATVYTTTTVTSITTSTLLQTSTTTILSSATTLPDGTCLTNDMNHPVLDYDAGANGYDTTKTDSVTCADFCYEKYFTYAGLFSGDQCFCGDTVNTYSGSDPRTDIGSGTVVDQTFCTQRCIGTFKKRDEDVCGGDRFILFYNASPKITQVTSCNYLRSTFKSTKMKIKRHLGWLEKYTPNTVTKRYVAAEEKVIDGFAWFHTTKVYKHVWLKHMLKVDAWRDRMAKRNLGNRELGER